MDNDTIELLRDVVEALRPLAVPRYVDDEIKLEANPQRDIRVWQSQINRAEKVLDRIRKQLNEKR